MTKRALIVDDEEDVRLVWTAVVQESGLEVIEAADGRAALEILEGDAIFDLMVLDIMMPQMDGYEVLRRLRQDERFKQLPVILATGNRSTQDLTGAPVDRLTSYVNKASGLENLRRAVAQALSSSSTES
jgi:CheY-like chemotaxis protein